MSHADAPAQHRAYAPAKLACAVLTVSDSRTLETDGSGRAIQERLEAAGHRVVERAIVTDDPERIRTAVLGAAARADVDAVIVNGGTGVSPRDSTPEAIEPLLYRRLDGFGEQFRALSVPEIGAAAMLSRATAGVAKGCVVIAMPGSPDAVRLAMDKLVVPELAHMVKVAR